MEELLRAIMNQEPLSDEQYLQYLLDAIPVEWLVSLDLTDKHYSSVEPIALDEVNTGMIAGYGKPRITDTPDEMMLDLLLTGYSLSMILHSDISWRSMNKKHINGSEYDFFYKNHRDLYLSAFEKIKRGDYSYLYEGFTELPHL